MRIAQPAHIIVATALLAFCIPTQALDLLKPFKGLLGSDDVIVWQGPGQFVKIVDQDRIKKDRRVPENSHPAELTPGQVAAALSPLKLDAGGKTVPVFTPAEVALLSEKLADGLKRATDRQEVVFAVIGGADGAGKHTTAGRVFVQGGKFQIIFGDVHGAVDGDTSDISHFTEPHRAGRRKERIDRGAVIAAGPGITHEVMNERERTDWVLINIPAAVATAAPAAVPVTLPAPIAAPGIPPSPQAVTTPAAPAPVTGAPITAEQQKQLDERRQMMEEMARLRKQVQDQQAAGGAAPAAPASAGSAAASPAGKSIEERMKQLQALHEKKLITDDEYAAKRKALLEEL